MGHVIILDIRTEPEDKNEKRSEEKRGIMKKNILQMTLERNRNRTGDIISRQKEKGDIIRNVNDVA